MSLLLSIQSYCSKKDYAGNTHIKCVPVNWVSEFPEFTNDGHNFSSTITLKASKQWLILPCVHDSINFRERDRETKQGSISSPEISAMISGDTPNIAAVLNSMRSDEWIVILTYKTGESKLIGSLEVPARFSSSFNNSGALTGTKGYEILFYSLSDAKSYFVEAPVQVELGTTISINNSEIGVFENGSTVNINTNIDVDTVSVNGNEVSLEMIVPWNRPLNWPPRPSGWETQTGVHMLVEHVGYNLVYFTCDQHVDLYVNGNLYLPIPANSSSTKLIELFPDDFASIDHGGTKWIWLYFDIPNGASVNWYANSTTLTGHLTGQLYSFLKFLKVVEEIVNMSALDRYINTDSGAIYSVKKTTDSLIFSPGCSINNSERLFGDIQLLNIENFPAIQSWGVQTFRGAIVPNLTVLGLEGITSLGAATFFNSFRGKSIRLKNSSSFTNLQVSFSGAYFSSIFVDDGSAITPSTNVVGSAYLQELIVNGLASTIAFYGNYFSENALLRSLNSFADLTGSPTQTVYIVGNHSHLDTASVNALAASKNWTLAFN